jgi:hypothetical protein
MTADQIAVGLSDEGVMVVFAIDGGSIRFASQQLSSPSGRWASPGAVPDVPNEFVAVTARRAFGHLFIGALVAAPADDGGRALSAFCVQWSSSSPTLGPMRTVDTVYLPATISIAQDALTAAPTLSIFSGSQRWICPAAGFGAAISTKSPTAAVAPPAAAYCVDGCAITDGFGKAEFYGVFSDNNLYQLVRAGAGWTWVPGVVNPPVGLKQVVATLNTNRDSAHQVELFAVSTSNTLLHLTLETQGRVANELGIPASALAVTEDVDGTPIVHVVGPGSGTLTTVVQEQESGTWTTQPVAIESLGTAEPVTTFTSELTIRDQLGQVRPNENVTVWADDLCHVSVNNVTAWVDATHSVQTTSDATGKVTVVIQTDSLGTPLLRVVTESMEKGCSLVIEPGLVIQGRLRTITADDLLAPTDMFGNPQLEPLLEAPYHTPEAAEQIAGALNACMTLAAPTVGAPTGVGRPTVRLIDRPNAPFSRRIALPAVPEQHWRLDFSEGRPQFRVLTRDQARTMILGHRTNRGVGDFLGLDWEDAWEAVKEGAGWIKEKTGALLDITVSYASGIISVAVTWVIDGVIHTWDGVVTLVQEVFDIVEGIFATVGAAFDRVFDWLAFAFDWDDIKRTAQVVKYLHLQSLNLLPAALHAVQMWADDEIEDLTSQVDTFFDHLAQSVIGKHDLITLQEPAKPSPAFSFSVSNNVLQTALLNNTGRGSVPDPPTLRDDADQDPVSQLIAELTQLGQNFHSNDGFSQALAYFEEMVDKLPTQPDLALRLGLAGVIETMKGLAGVALATVRLIVDALLAVLEALVAAVTETLNFGWEIPLVSELYQYLTNSTDPLTPADLIALIVAVPATVFFKITEKSAPFPDDASVAQFEAFVNADTIADLIGTNGKAPRAQAWPHIPTGVLDIVYIINLVADLGWGCTMAAADIQEPSLVPQAPTPSEFGYSVASVVFEDLVFLTGCPAWSEDEPTKWAMWVWLVGGTAGLLVDGAFLCFARKVTQLNGDVGVALSVVTGVVNICLAGAWAIFGSPGILEIIAAFLASLPGYEKLWRTSPMEMGAKAAGVQGANRAILAGIDVVGILGAGVLNCIDDISALSPPDRA